MNERWLVQVCTHITSLKVRHFGIVAATALKLWRVVNLNGMACLLDIIKFHQLFYKFIGGADTQDDFPFERI
jgi:hypothetical protein